MYYSVVLQAGSNIHHILKCKHWWVLRLCLSRTASLTVRSPKCAFGGCLNAAFLLRLDFSSIRFKLQQIIVLHCDSHAVHNHIRLLHSLLITIDSVKVIVCSGKTVKMDMLLLAVGTSISWCSKILGYCSCKGDQLNKWRIAKSGVSEIGNPWTDCHKIWHGWLRRRYHPARQNSNRTPHCWRTGKARVLRQNRRTDFYGVTDSQDVNPGYCIPKVIKLQKVSVFPILPKHHKTGVNRHFRPTRI